MVRREGMVSLKRNPFGIDLLDRPIYGPQLRAFVEPRGSLPPRVIWWSLSVIVVVQSPTFLVRREGIEPSSQVWETRILPMNYRRLKKRNL